MKIVVDKYVPLPDERLAEFAEIVRLEPEAITASAVRDADALIIRTRTIINEALLSGSKVQFVATATIGFDHIDTSFCEKHGVVWTSCPGCNAQAVCDYVEEALNSLNAIGTLGVVGVGHIGSLVARMAERKGMKVLLNDPPEKMGVDLAEIAEKCDYITFHTPLTKAPHPYPTYHLCDAAFLAKCKPNATIINAARGGIVDEPALLQSGKRCVIDCWENEPHINVQLLQSPQTALASFHIAGYSLAGKINASQMCLDALCKHFALPRIIMPLPQKEGDCAEGWLKRVSDQLKATPEQFELLRKKYKLR